jgi:hypothetical protein
MQFRSLNLRERFSGIRLEISASIKPYGHEQLSLEENLPYLPVFNPHLPPGTIIDWIQRS